MASRACDTDPDSALPHRLLGELYHLHLGSKSLAMEHYEEAHSKGDVDATTNLGILCHEQGEVVRARRLYEEAYSQGLGVLCRDQGDRVRARLLFEEAHSKGEMDATLSLGQLRMKQGDMVRTRQLYKETHSKGDLFVTINFEMLCGEWNLCIE